MSKNRKLDIIGIVIFSIILAFYGGLQTAYTWTGTSNTLSDGYAEVENINVSTGVFFNDEDRTHTLQYPEQASSYIIFKSGSTIYAKSGTTGQIDYSGSDAATVIQSALDALTSGRTWKERVVLNGNFSLSDRIRPSSYTILDLRNCRLTLEDGVDKSIISPVGSSTDIETWGGILYGNKAGQTSAGHGIEASAERMLIWNPYIYDTFLDGIYLRYADEGVTIIGGTYLNNGRDGIAVRETIRIKIIRPTIIDPNNQGINFEPGATEVCDDILIDGASVNQTSSGTWGISIGSATGGDITNVRVINCNLNGTTSDGIYFANTVGARAKNNMIEGYTRNIWIQSGSDIIVSGNEGYVTENSGTQTCANNENITHGLAGTPTWIQVTPMTDTYDSVAVIATVDWTYVDATNIQVGLYWINGTVISDDTILVTWKTEYEP